MKRIAILLMLVSGQVIADIPSILVEGESELQTNTPLLIQFHSVLYYPSEISLDFPGFIVGIEKSYVDSVTTSKADIKTIDVPDTKEDAEGYKDRLVDEKIMYISHVVQDYGLPYGQKNCAIYNAYFRKFDVIARSINFCKGSEEKQIEPKKAYIESWSAINKLHTSVNAELNNGSYTHIVVAAMGWNTAQEEAVRNFNSLIKNISIASPKEKFKPLFVGVTWPSLWQSSWFDPIFKVLSYPTKSTDADEVGFSWLGAVLHYSLANLDKKLPIIVIGHSFGARATSMASCVGSAISENAVLKKRNKIDLLISLQGAYSMNRYFIDKGKEKIKYPDFCSNANKVVLTSSANDKAMDTGKWVPFVGNDKTFNKFCKKTGNGYAELDDHINCADIKSPISPAKGIFFNKNDKKILYLNADELIKYNAYLSGGGAHSDIYRIEMGVVLWQLIDKYGKIR